MNEKTQNMKNQIERTELKLKKLRKRMKKICPHDNIEMTHGYTDYSSYYHDYYEGHIKCLDCGLYATENSKDPEEKERYNLLYKIYEANRKKIIRL